MSSVFISYSRKDERLARQLAAALSDRGFEVWIDVEDIPPGMKWSRAIQQGLDNADAMTVLISPDSMASTNVEDEWQYFLDQRKAVIPALVREAKVHFQLSRIQYVDFLRQPFDVAFTQLVDVLLSKGLTPGPGVTRPVAVTTPLTRKAPLWAWGLGVAGVIALLLFLLLPRANVGGLDSATGTTTLTGFPSDTLPPSVTPSRTTRPVFSPDELTATEQAAFDLAFTEIAQTEQAATIAANAPAATEKAGQTATAHALTVTADAFTDTPTPNRLQTIVAGRATQTQVAGQTATVLALTPTAIPTDACVNALPPRLVLGETGRVIDDGVPQRVRITPSVGADVVATLDPGAIFTVMDGPLCGQGNGLMWWRIAWDGGDGWTAESQDGVYFLEPVPIP
ncbi:MAG TPA: toll/interleukin-1 receptor domain-containing protein [Candidatus Limnocylindrales bacterium]|nr:toll/interleukin-1 receptor domain-containing protein [Candidatus Limnocylindrales bacterium]